MGEFSRRDFIKTACISVGALAASSSGVYALDDSSKMDKDTNLPSCDVLVIGSGGAGLRAAAAVRKENPKLSVVVATKMMPSRTQLVWQRVELTELLIFLMEIPINYMLMILLKAELIW